MSWEFPLTNMTEGGEGCNGGKGSLGYKHTQEAKQRISEANSSIVRTREWVNRVAKSNSKPVLQLNLDGTIVKHWDSSTEAAIALGNIDKKKNITNVTKGKRKSAYGFAWKITEVRDKEPLR